MRFWLFLSLFTCTIFCAPGCRKQEVHKSADSPTLTLSVDETRLLTSYVDGLSGIAAKSPTADSLLTFYRSAATLARSLDAEQVQALEAPKGEIFFFVAPLPGSYTTPLVKQGSVAAQYGNRIMQLHNNGFSSFVRGLLLGHEIVHAEDDLLRDEPPSEPLSDTWLAGEGNAHSRVFKILDEYSDGQWRQKALESAHERRTWALENGYSEAAMTFNASDADSVRMTEIFGPISFDDVSMLLTQFTVDANILNLQKVAAGDTEKFHGLVGEFLYEFYSRYEAKAALTQ